MKQRVLVLILFVITQINVFCQFQVAKEKVVSKPKEIIDNDSIIKYIIGIDGNQLIFSLDYFNNDCYETKALIYYDERSKKVLSNENIYTDKNYRLISSVKKNSIELQKVFNSKKYGNNNFCDIDDKDLLVVNYYVKIVQKDYFLDITNNFSDEIDISISDDSRYIIYSTFTGEYLRDVPSDSLIFIYDFDAINNNEPLKTVLTCKECIKPQIIGDYMYYGKKFFYYPGADAYDWKIYRVPKFDLSKSELLAEYIEIILVSPDGKYILGKKYLHAKACLVILNTETKQFNYLLGRDYLQYKYFYSPTFQQFAFDTGNNIIYINYPEFFPFNSIGKDAERVNTSKEANRQFWEKYQLPPLIEK